MVVLHSSRMQQKAETEADTNRTAVCSIKNVLHAGTVAVQKAAYVFCVSTTCLCVPTAAVVPPAVVVGCLLVYTACLKMQI